MVRHSAGSVTAVETYFEAPNRVAALILVAPAIIAPLSAPKSENKKNLPQENQVQESNCASDRHPNILVRLGQVLSNLFRYIADIVMKIWKGMMNVVSFLYNRAIVAILRSTVAVMLVRFYISS